MALYLYLTFDGNCREAFNFYAAALDGEILGMTTFAEAPESEGPCAGREDKIMHGSLKVGESTLLASDSPDVAGQLIKGGNFSICVESSSREQTDLWLSNLSAGGQITVPAEETFWGAYFAMCTDRFGISWMLMHDLSQESAGS